MSIKAEDIVEVTEFVYGNKQTYRAGSTWEVLKEPNALGMIFIEDPRTKGRKAWLFDKYVRKCEPPEGDTIAKFSFIDVLAELERKLDSINSLDENKPEDVTLAKQGLKEIDSALREMLES